MTFIQAAKTLSIRLLDRIVPMKLLFKEPRFKDLTNNRMVYLYRERVSGRMMMAHHCLGLQRVHHHECEQFEMDQKD